MAKKAPAKVKRTIKQNRNQADNGDVIRISDTLMISIRDDGTLLIYTEGYAAVIDHQEVQPATVELPTRSTLRVTFTPAPYVAPDPVDFEPADPYAGRVDMSELMPDA